MPYKLRVHHGPAIVGKGTGSIRGLKTNHERRDSGSRRKTNLEARNPERKAEPIVIPGFPDSFPGFQIRLYPSLPSRRLDAGSGGPLAPRKSPLMLRRLTFLLLRHDEILSISARLQPW